MAKKQAPTDIVTLATRVLNRRYEPSREDISRLAHTVLQAESERSARMPKKASEQVAEEPPTT